MVTVKVVMARVVKFMSRVYLLSEKDIYWEIVRLRKQMCLAKLGYIS